MVITCLRTSVNVILCLISLFKIVAVALFSRAVRARMPAEGDGLESVTAALSSLSVSGTGNVVHVHITGSRRSGGAAASSNGAAEAAPKAAAKAAPLRGRRKWYVIVHCARAPGLVGIWHTTWGQLAQELPGKQLFGSTARPCKACATLDEAKAVWEEWAPERTFVVFER